LQEEDYETRKALERAANRFFWLSVGIERGASSGETTRPPCAGAWLHIHRARLNVLERAVAMFMVKTNEPVAIALEDWLRSYNEHGVTSSDPEKAEELRQADLAAVRFADVLAVQLSRKSRR